MRRKAIQLLAFFALTCTTASAHSVMPGMGHAWNGALHPLFTPTHMLILLPIGLAMGARKLRGVYPFLALFIPATALGLGLTFVWPAGQVWNFPLALLAIAMGANLALALPTDRPFHIVIGVIAGFIVGLDSAPESTLSLGAKASTLIATLISITVITADLAFYTSVFPDRKWIQIGFRVAGAWIVAISMLILAFSLRKPVF